MLNSDIIMLIILFFVKIFDNIFMTGRSLLIYKNRKLLSSTLTIINQLMFYFIISKVIADNTLITIIIVSFASGIGNQIAMIISEKFEKDSKYTNYITSSDIDFMLKLNQHLINCKVKCILSPCLNRKGENSYSLTIFANTKAQSKIIDEYLDNINRFENPKTSYLREVLV